MQLVKVEIYETNNLKDFIQFPNMNIVSPLNKPFVNGGTFREQKLS